VQDCIQLLMEFADMMALTHGLVLSSIAEWSWSVFGNLVVRAFKVWNLAIVDMVLYRITLRVVNLSAEVIGYYLETQVTIT